MKAVKFKNVVARAQRGLRASRKIFPLQTQVKPGRVIVQHQNFMLSDEESSDESSSDERAEGHLELEMSPLGALGPEPGLNQGEDPVAESEIEPAEGSGVESDASDVSLVSSEINYAELAPYIEVDGDHSVTLLLDDGRKLKLSNALEGNNVQFAVSLGEVQIENLGADNEQNHFICVKEFQRGQEDVIHGGVYEVDEIFTNGGLGRHPELQGVDLKATRWETSPLRVAGVAGAGLLSGAVLIELLALNSGVHSDIQNGDLVFFSEKGETPSQDGINLMEGLSRLNFSLYILMLILLAIKVTLALQSEFQEVTQGPGSVYRLSRDGQGPFTLEPVSERGIRSAYQDLYEVEV